MKLIILLILIISSWTAIYKSTFNKFNSPFVNQIKTSEPIKIDLSEKLMENLTDEQKQQLEKIGIGKGSMVTEVYTAASFINPNKQKEIIISTQDKFSSIKKYFSTNITDIKNNAVLFLASITIVIFISTFLHLWHFLRLICGLLFSLSKILLIVISISSIFVAYFYQYNIWNYADFLLFWLPGCTLLFGAIGFHILDPNYPVWKTLYKGFLLPLFSSIIISFI